MIVRVGITSFYSRNVLPEFLFDDFKRIVYGCAIATKFSELYNFLNDQLVEQH